MSDKNSEEVVLLREILKWIRFSGIKEVRAVLMNALDTEQKRMIYHLSDGKRGSVEISKAVNVGDSTVRRYWEMWFRFGIVESLGVQRGLRYKKSFELGDFGFDIPQMKIADTASKKESVENTTPTEEVKTDE